MKLTELKLTNFGVFRGENVVDLFADDADKSIVLIGGRNGAGKTTLLEAILLALYGKRSPGVKRQASSYENFLRSMITKGEESGAAVRLSIEGLSGYYGQIVELARAWTPQKRGVHETFQVFVDGWVDDVLTHRWAEHIERVAPASVSNLFFFDGERIENFADPLKAAEAIENSLESLLGLNEVVQLRRDLAVFRQKRLASDTTGEERQALETDYADVERLKSIYQEQIHKQASLHDKEGYIDKELERLKARFEKAGGDLYQKRESLRAELDEAAESQERAFARILSLAVSGSGPLAAATGLLERALHRKQSEKDHAEEAFASHALRRRENDILRTASEMIELDRDAIEQLRSILRGAFETSTGAEYALSEESLGVVFATSYELSVSSRAAHQKAEALSEGLTTYRNTVEEYSKAEALVENIPSENEIAALITQLNGAERRRTEIERELSELEESMQKTKNELDQSRERYRRTTEKIVEESVSSIEEKRLLSISQAAEESLVQIEGKLKRKLLRRLEQEIVDKASRLLSKRELVRNVVINNETYVPEIYNSKNEHVELWDLSAGERQLFALSMLWSFATIANVDLPLVIDTPLGRLDRTHRHHFAERFLPAASHQTLVLSTDQEIHGELFNIVEPYVSTAYTLVNDDDHGGSSIHEGYMFVSKGQQEPVLATS